MAAATDDEFSKAAIGARLVVTREALGYSSQTDFADKAGLAQNTYNQYETGAKRPSLDFAIKLCRAYGITLDWIYMGDPSGLPYKLADAIREVRRKR